MRTTVLDPFWRNSVGFDRLFNLIEESTRAPQMGADSYPPYNIAKLGDDKFRIAIAVAGFRPEQIDITAHQNTLIVSAQEANENGQVEYLYRGIAGTSFERRFSLADYVEVTGASFQDGVLYIDLERRVPDAMKPRKIEVKAAGTVQPALSNKAA